MTEEQLLNYSWLYNIFDACEFEFDKDSKKIKIGRKKYKFAVVNDTYEQDVVTLPMWAVENDIIFLFVKDGYNYPLWTTSKEIIKKLKPIKQTDKYIVLHSDQLNNFNRLDNILMDKRSKSIKQVIK